MVQLCGLLLHLQNHAYHTGIMLDAFAHVATPIMLKNYAGIIDSGLMLVHTHNHELLIPYNYMMQQCS